MAKDTSKFRRVKGKWTKTNRGDEYTGLDVTLNGETTRYYFTIQDGINYFQRGIGAMPEQTPLNMSAKEFKARVENNGAITKTLTDSDYQRERKAYIDRQHGKPDYELGMGLKDNREYRKTARENRLMSRAMKKRWK